MADEILPRHFGNRVFLFEYTVGLDGLCATVAIVLLLRNSAIVATPYNGTGGNNVWRSATNWRPQGVPVSGDTVNFTFTDAISRMIIYDDTGPPVTLDELVINRSPGNVFSSPVAKFLILANQRYAVSEYVGTTDNNLGGYCDGVMRQLGGTNSGCRRQSSSRFRAGWTRPDSWGWVWSDPSGPSFMLKESERGAAQLPRDPDYDEPPVAVRSGVNVICRCALRFDCVRVVWKLPEVSMRNYILSVLAVIACFFNGHRR